MRIFGEGFDSLHPLIFFPKVGGTCASRQIDRSRGAKAAPTLLLFLAATLTMPTGIQAAGGHENQQRRATQDLLGVVMRDHVTNYSKGNTDTARMMTPFLASKLFGSIESNPMTSFCPSLNVQGH